jgi:predicted transcriptional regulator
LTTAERLDILKGMETLTEIRIDPAKLRAARGDRSIASVAREIGISRQQLWNYENDLAAVSANVIARLCHLYGVQITDLATVA